MDKCMAKHSTFEEAIECWNEEHGTAKFKSTGALEYDFIAQLRWALKRGWIIRM
jgi:hypothetical protein